MTYAVGSLVKVRGREWVVETVPDGSNAGPPAFELACIDDDAQGERLIALLDAEIAVARVEDDAWRQLGFEPDTESVEDTIPGTDILPFAFKPDIIRGHRPQINFDQ